MKDLFRHNLTASIPTRIGQPRSHAYVLTGFIDHEYAIGELEEIELPTEGGPPDETGTAL